MRTLPPTGHPRTYSVLAVTARLQSPMASYDEAIHLDSLLVQDIARRRGLAASGADRDTPLSTFAAVPIPLRHVDHAGHRVVLSSAGILADDWRSGLERLTKKKDEADIAARAGPWKVGAGPERAYCVPVPTIEASSIAWLAIGRRRQVMQALRTIRRVGGWRRHGYGLVSEWSAEVADIDPAEVLVGGGMARRHLPVSWCLSAGGVDSGRIASPYWHPDGQVQRVRAGVACEVLPEVTDLVRAQVSSWA